MRRNHCIRRRRLLVMLERPSDDNGHGVVKNAFAENLTKTKKVKYCEISDNDVLFFDTILLLLICMFPQHNRWFGCTSEQVHTVCFIDLGKLPWSKSVKQTVDVHFSLPY